MCQENHFWSTQKQLYARQFFRITILILTFRWKFIHLDLIYPYVMDSQEIKVQLLIHNFAWLSNVLLAEELNA